VTARVEAWYAFTPMIVVLILIFSLVALSAAAFVVLPMLRTRETMPEAGPRRAWPAIAAGLATMAVGLGTYALLGQPEIALTELTGPSRTDYRALIATLARRMPQRPGDIEGWTLLGRGYLALGNAGQAEKAFGHAVEASKLIQGNAPPELLSNYGEAMTEFAIQQQMAAWNAWMENAGSAVVDFGNPFAARTAVADDGATRDAGDLNGYTIVEAADLTAATALTEKHPFLSEGKGRFAIEVYELAPM